MHINNSHLKKYLLITILVVAAILRLQHINQPFTDSFSWREASTAMMAENFYRTNWNIFYPEVNWSGPGPNYQGREFQTISYITALIYLVVGQHDWVGRSVAVAFGLWGIFALYQLVRLVWDEKHALVSAAVMAVLPGSIFVERSFLPDPAMVALVTTCLWMLVAYLQTENFKYLLLASLFGSWGCLTKITGLIVGIPAIYAIFINLKLAQRQRTRQIIMIVGAMDLTLIPIISYYLWARHLAMTYPPYHFAGDGFWIWDGIEEWWEQKFFLPHFFRNLKTWLWTTPGILLVLLGLFCLPPSRIQGSKKLAVSLKIVDSSSEIRWLFHWWFCGFIFFFLIGAHELYANAWNLHIVNPIAATLAGRAIIVIATFITMIVTSISPIMSQKFQLMMVNGIIILLLLILNISGQKALSTKYQPINWYADQSYKLGIALDKISQPSDLVVTLAHALGDPVAIYYSYRRGWVFNGEGPSYPEQKLGDDILPHDDNISIQILENFRKKHAVWLGIVGIHYSKIKTEHPLLLEYLKKNYQLKQTNSEFTIYQFLNSQ